MNFNCSENKLLLIHFLSIDYQIKLDTKEQQKQYIYKISNTNYEVYCIYLDDKSAKFTISPLFFSDKEQNKNRNYPLIINSIEIEDSKISELIVKENDPIFLSFNNKLKKVNLVYKFENNNIGHPLIISFWIKEKIKFKIEISDLEKNIIINRTINYKEKIIINPKPKKIYNILITQDEGIIINSTMIVKIIQDNSTPLYLQKNQLNLGFIPIGIDYYYYYMEVFKGEEGEIILFNKRQNGILISKIIEKNNKIIPKINEFPKYNGNDVLSEDYLEFNIYNQKLNFNYSQTKKCEEGCFLLITYYSNISNSLEINGTEFSLLSRILDEDLFPQITNIPLDEYIFSFFDDTSVNIHYYSVFIPYETDNIYIEIEINGKNIFVYSKQGITKINSKKITDETKKLFEEYQNKIIIKLNKEDIGLSSFKGKYVSFAFENDNNDNDDNHSFYYFRILQKNPENNYIIYPLDTNKENICETNNNKCYFVLKMNTMIYQIKYLFLVMEKMIFHTKYFI